MSTLRPDLSRGANPLMTASGSRRGSPAQGPVPRTGWRSRLLLVVPLGLLSLAAPSGLSASFAEPETVFYGRVIGTGSAQPFLVTEGTLRWTVLRPDGTPLELRARLWPFRDGTFSYRLNVPHTALASGLSVEPGQVALRTSLETQIITGISVNGVPARVADGGETTFDTAQILRAATHRLDLEVPLSAPDSDGDGLPDWWEARHGGELQPGDDPDGDGRTNREEYLAGTDPLRNDRSPTLVTTEIRAYADGATGVLLRVLDADTSPERLIHTLTRPPTGARLLLRNAHPQPSSPDAVLAAGSTFTQRDVLTGRLLLVHDGGAAEADSFEVTLRDENPAHAPATGTIGITWYRPSSETTARLAAHGPVPDGPPPAWVEGLADDEWRRAGNYLMSRESGMVIWDASDETLDLELSVPTSGLTLTHYQEEYRSRYGAERRQMLIGGRGRDTLVGGMEADILVGGPGDDRLTGGGGGDLFRFRAGDGSSHRITDFDPDEGDVLDLAGLLRGASGALRDVLRIDGQADATRFTVQRGANAGGPADQTITLQGVARAEVDLHDWIETGTLVVGELSLPSRVTVVAHQPRASENGPTEGGFEFSRTGPATLPLTIRIELRGSALNGTDYASLDSTVVFPVAQRTVRLMVTPYQDSQPEPDETVELLILPGEGYEVGGADRARVTIADLKPVVSLEALESLATVQPARQGTLLISRTTVVDRTLLVRLEFAGTAVPGTDYLEVARFVHLAPGQTTALVPIVLAPGATLGEGARSVMVSLAEDAAYLRGPTGRAEVLLVQETIGFAGWRAKHFPAHDGSLTAFGAGDDGNRSIPNALRYAFGMDPRNPDRARMPRVVVRDGHLTLDVHRRPGARDVEFVIETSSDMKRWTPNAALIERAYPPEQAGQPDVLCYRVIPSIHEAPHLFLNLRVVLRP